MGAFFPAGLKLVIDGFLAAQTALHVSWHTALPSTRGGLNEYVLNGIGRVAVGTLTTSSDTNSCGRHERDGDHVGWCDRGHGRDHAHRHRDGGDRRHVRGAGRTWHGGDAWPLGEKIRIPAGDLDVSFPIA